MEIMSIGASRLESVLGLFARVVDEMRRGGIDQWDERYPDRATIEADLLSGSAFALIGSGLPVAYVALNGEQSAEYGAIPWLDASGRPLVIHRLCVDPAFRGRGAARRLLAFAEAHAAERGFTSVRLDAFTKNPAALALYASGGYDRRGQVTFRKGVFDCFEKSTRRPLTLPVGQGFN